MTAVVETHTGTGRSMPRPPNVPCDVRIYGLIGAFRLTCQPHRWAHTFIENKSFTFVAGVVAQHTGDTP